MPPDISSYGSLKESRFRIFMLGIHLICFVWWQIFLWLVCQKIPCSVFNIIFIYCLAHVQYLVMLLWLFCCLDDKCYVRRYSCFLCVLWNFDVFYLGLHPTRTLFLIFSNVLFRLVQIQPKFWWEFARI